MTITVFISYLSISCHDPEHINHMFMFKLISSQPLKVISIGIAIDIGCLWKGNILFIILDKEMCRKLTTYVSFKLMVT